jgi:hypothetical protein
MQTVDGGWLWMDLRYVVEYVDQRQVQRYGGSFTKYPSSYIVCRLLRSYGLKRVLDVTYGEGRFYRLCFPELVVIGADPVKWSWVVKPKQFHQLNVFQLYLMLRDGKLSIDPVDVVVVDPPRWNTDVVYRKRDMFNFIIGTPKLIIEYATKVAQLLKTRHILVHYRELMKLEGFEPVHVVEFTWVARYAYTDNKNKSLYIIYRWVDQ